MIACFSERHKSHVVFPFSKVLQCFKIFHSIFGFSFILLSHRYFDSVVSFLYFSCLKLFLWLLNLNLKFVWVAPMYIAFLLSWSLTVAWYIIFSAQQLPGIGHFYLFLQFHFFCSFCLLLVSF